VVAQNGQSIETGNAGHTRQRIKTKQKHKKPTKCALDTTIRKQTQITLIRHEPSYKQLEVKMNQPSFVCGNHNTNPKRQDT
jgi:galactose mutarotase-like enzyme